MKHFTKILFLLVFWTPSSFAEDNDTLLMLSDGSFGAYWEIKKIKRPYYPRDAALNGVEGCAAIAFVIESNGSTSSYRPLAGYPSEVFLRPAIDAIKKWRFFPSETNQSRQPVYTFQVIEFSLSPGPSGDDPTNQEISDSCSAAANKSFNSDAGEAGSG